MAVFSARTTLRQALQAGDRAVVAQLVLTLDDDLPAVAALDKSYGEKRLGGRPLLNNGLDDSWRMDKAAAFPGRLPL